MNPEPFSHRICFVSTGLAKGGAESQLFRAAAGLHARGLDVHVVSILSSDYYGARLEQAGVPLVCLDASRTTSPARILTRFLQYLKDVRPSALAGFDYPGSMLARVGGAVARIPVVISSIRTENLGTSLRKHALAWTDSLATVTTTNSESVARRLVDAGAISRGRIRVIPNGLDVQTVSPALRKGRSALRRSLGVEDADFFWFAAGGLEAPKDYPNLLAAMALLAKVAAPMKLAVAGKGSLLGMLRDRTTSLGLERVVSFLGVREDVPACLAAADGTVLASAWEGLPNILIESLAVGTPVVCTDVGGAREVVVDGRSGVVVAPRSPEVLAAAMARLMACPVQQRHRMGAAGRTHVENTFALDAVLNRWSGLFRELLDAA
jgi:glycosyltransferase involved in cell wall biosynthesis